MLILRLTSLGLEQATPLKGLPAWFDATAFLVDAEGVALLYKPVEPQMDIPKDETWFVRIGLGGNLRGRPQRVTKGMPAPFAKNNFNFFIDPPDRSKKTRRLLRREGESQVGTPTPLPTLHSGPNDPPQIDYAWTGDRLLLATASYENRAWQIVVHSVRCDGKPLD